MIELASRKYSVNEYSDNDLHLHFPEEIKATFGVLNQ
jgi:hypothetical protein